MGAPPTKTSFGPDGKKQFSLSTNDLQKLFLGRESPFPSAPEANRTQAIVRPTIKALAPSAETASARLSRPRGRTTQNDRESA